jgi:hypothetical protein
MLPQKKIYRKYMQAWLANTNEGTLIMCHPATEKVIPHDADWSTKAG